MVVNLFSSLWLVLGGLVRCSCAEVTCLCSWAKFFSRGFSVQFFLSHDFVFRLFFGRSSSELISVSCVGPLPLQGILSNCSCHQLTWVIQFRILVWIWWWFGTAAKNISKENLRLPFTPLWSPFSVLQVQIKWCKKLAYFITKTRTSKL